MNDKVNTLENRIFNYERRLRQFQQLTDLLDAATEDLWDAEAELPIWANGDDYDRTFVQHAEYNVYPDLQPMMGPEEYIELPF